ncbi:hypothetical protein CHLNCDRAFT_138898 [Chlorella variabilis]|uniref:GST N-terminal domain-containing protein n=1 Tax=Chlorella variabilis TaxID=554065 RepID=E1ZNW3_CHLVA|nr:hypothetical protein CHLNCDRAFT_138898 [Chlorella variabilis]EFN52508.1 hypothetical protein CHLNCDRAFT_138898 [Chlorella variabilis]|eukprot:XP_005844610.1 hypothetical protein CHLNCDRAFT_138898 [Chlorella variabilis]
MAATPSAESPALPTLVTIGVSHFCEKARWALQRYGLAYVEDTHPPGFHRPAAKRVGGRRATPCLGLPTGGCVDGSDAILRWVDEQRGAAGKPGLPLYPQEPAAAEEVTRLCRLFDKELGPAARVWAYSHLLYTRQIAEAMASPPAPWGERLAMRMGLWLVTRSLMARGLGINAENGAAAFEVVQRVFVEVDALLADGRPFLTGQQFTAADLTFAALAAPAVGQAYANALGLSEAMPAAMREQTERGVVLS